MKRIIFTFLGLLMLCPLVAQWDVLPDRMWADSMHVPFQLGVASGDPLPNAVIIWTRIDENVGTAVNWQMAADADMTDIVQSGTVAVSAETDWTVKIDVVGLVPYTTYYYQFSDEDGNLSAVGRTKTAPDGDSEVEELKFGVASCSSIFSGYFNAYARMAERDDLDLVIHLGDYIYDFVDDDEPIRVPEPFPIDPQTKEEFWQRHRYYLHDPDLRAVRQQHPFFAMWDNHDIYKNNETDLLGSIEAFYHYLPIRQADINEPKRIYRTLHYGELADIVLMDIELWRNQDVIPMVDSASLLGNTQYDWVTNELQNSTATWHIIGNQKLFSNWAIDHVEADLPFGDGNVADPNSWDGFPEERERLLTFLKDNDIENNIVLSGDIHLSVAADLAINPKDSIGYNLLTGEGAVGVEFTPASITRGNLDEQVGDVPIALIDFLLGLSLEGNPHHEYIEVIQHGYGLLHINADSTIAQFIYSEKLEVVETDTIFQELVVREGENHWVSGPPMEQTEETEETEMTDVTPEDTMNVALMEIVPTLFDMSSIKPNPTRNKSSFSLTVKEAQKVNIHLYESQGQKSVPIQRIYEGILSPNDVYDFSVHTANLAAGVYLIRVEGELFSTYQKLVVY